MANVVINEEVFYNLGGAIIGLQTATVTVTKVSDSSFVTSTTSDAAGRFSVSVPEGVDYYFTATKANYTSNAILVRVPNLTSGGGTVLTGALSARPAANSLAVGTLYFDPATNGGSTWRGDGVGSGTGAGGSGWTLIAAPVSTGSGSSPTGAASGDLSSNYPNPTVANAVINPPKMKVWGTGSSNALQLSSAEGGSWDTRLFRQSATSLGLEGTGLQELEVLGRDLAGAGLRFSHISSGGVVTQRWRTYMTNDGNQFVITDQAGNNHFVLDSGAATINPRVQLDLRTSDTLLGTSVMLNASCNLSTSFYNSLTNRARSRSTWSSSNSSDAGHNGLRLITSASYSGKTVHGSAGGTVLTLDGGLTYNTDVRLHQIAIIYFDTTTDLITIHQSQLTNIDTASGNNGSVTPRTAFTLATPLPVAIPNGTPFAVDPDATGFENAVGGYQSWAIAGASGSPITLTTSGSHNITAADIAAGRSVIVGNVGGNTNANGVWLVTAVPTTTQITLGAPPNGGAAPNTNAAYTSGGYVAPANNPSTSFGDFWNIQSGGHTHNGRGSYNIYDHSFTISGASTAYAEGSIYTGHITNNRLGSLAVVGEWGLVVNSTTEGGANAGPAKAAPVCFILEEQNDYANYATAFFTSNSFRQSGSRGVWVLSQGDKPGGTGLYVGSNANGWVRSAVWNNNGTDVFTIDKNGRIGIGVTYNQSGIVASALNYTTTGGFTGALNIARQTSAPTAIANVGIIYVDNSGNLRYRGPNNDNLIAAA